jgi:predicted molibdopterin-dependent oxidoreductase YjgC
MTGKTTQIDEISPECFAEVHPHDAERLGLKEKNWVRLTSRRGSVQVRAIITDKTQEGTIFCTYNHLQALVNLLTLDALDRLSRSPEYKLCAIKVDVLGDELPD